MKKILEKLQFTALGICSLIFNFTLIATFTFKPNYMQNKERMNLFLIPTFIISVTIKTIISEEISVTLAALLAFFYFFIIVVVANATPLKRKTDGLALYYLLSISVITDTVYIITKPLIEINQWTYDFDKSFALIELLYSVIFIILLINHFDKRVKVT